MQRRMTAALLIGCLLAMPARADEPVDGPKTIFRDDLMDKLVGEWKLTRSIRGLRVENTVKSEWVLNHQFLKIHMKDVKEPASYEAIVFVGYSHADSEYICHWLDVFGGKFSAMGKGKRKGDSIEFIFNYDDGPFRNTFTWNAADKGWNFHMESRGKDGTWKLFADDALRRP
jgi:hypothetical protein